MPPPWHLRRAPAAAALLLAALGVAGCSGAGRPSHTATSSARLPLTGGTPAATGVAAASHTPGAPTTVILFLTTPAHPGGHVRLSVSAAPRAVCKETVSFPGTSLDGSTPVTRTASTAGEAAWAWTLGSHTPTGDWPLTVSCTPGGSAQTVLSVR